MIGYFQKKIKPIKYEIYDTTTRERERKVIDSEIVKVIDISKQSLVIILVKI